MKSRVITILVILILIAGTGYYWKQNQKASLEEQAVSDTTPTTEESTDERPSEVALSDEKLKNMQLTVAPVKRQPLSQIRMVPGRLKYDDRKHVSIKAPADGVLVEVRVKTGDVVKTGQVLAVLNSPEIGTARADLLQRTAEYELAKKQYDWKSEIQNNVQKLVDALLSKQPMDEIEKEFKNEKLGDYRSQLLPAYSRYLLAEMINSKSAPLAKSGAISLQSLKKRETEMQDSRAALKSLCEQSIYDVRLERDREQARLNDAEHRMTISRQNLEALMGSAVDPGSKDLKAAEKLSRLEVIAPFAGTIEERNFSRSERVIRSDVLFTLAQTDTLWVAADIRESDWAAVSLDGSQNLKVKVNAYPDETFSARLYYLGRSVSPVTNSVPLIAEIKNPEGKLRPGMFVQVMIPGKQKSNVITVPARSVLDDAQQEFVFVKTSDRSFRRVDIQSGLKTEDWVEVQNGLTEGEQVVEEGAFTLKSELLLEREE
ncbi:efflux RND transporter periplasmic adaptor subunit [Gimesia panareensis]|uniref:efflux RND transporter periplasmic adaptor subunit n=1 Tax=Gimesia panareensis TaxID=2527978 RepID=UPI0011898D1D|nr:efflux RND transporter periplasmic adaptor subunit [Gimesia panareensis]QDU50916.1 Cation efflux system protein CusB precursor [Gimesia panareensis]